jgi:hypothetical protein
VLEAARSRSGRFDTPPLETIEFLGRGGAEVAAAAVAAAIHRWNVARRRAPAGRANDRSGWLARRAGDLAGWPLGVPPGSTGSTGSDGSAR